MDHDELVRRFHTPREELSAEQAAQREQLSAEEADLRARGNVATPEMQRRHEGPLGLDENLDPFPDEQQ